MLFSLRCDCGLQLERPCSYEKGRGAVLYLRQEDALLKQDRAYPQGGVGSRQRTCLRDSAISDRQPMLPTWHNQSSNADQYHASQGWRLGLKDRALTRVCSRQQQILAQAQLGLCWENAAGERIS